MGVFTAPGSIWWAHTEDLRADLELNTPTSMGIWMELFGSHCRNQAKLTSLGLGAKPSSLKARVMGKMDSGWR